MKAILFHIETSMKSAFCLVGEFLSLRNCKTLFSCRLQSSISLLILPFCLSYQTYLDGTGSDVAVMRKTCCEWGSIIEGVLGLTLGELELLLESVNLLPVLKYFLLLSGEVGSLRDYRFKVS